MFKLSQFSCDLRIAMRDEAAGSDIDNKPPPIPSLKQLVVYKPVKYPFQECKNATLCV